MGGGLGSVASSSGSSNSSSSSSSERYKGAFSRKSFSEAGDYCTGRPSTISHHHVQQTVVLGMLSLSASVSAHQPKKRSCRDDDMACTGGDGFEARKLVDKTWPGKPGSKNPRTVMFGVQSFLLYRHEFVKSCLHCNGFPPETV